MKNARYVVLFLAAIVMGSTRANVPQAETVPFSVPGTGLMFNHPKTWKVVTDRRETRLTIPVDASGNQAVIHFFATDFRAEIARWEQAQRDIAKQFHRTIARQWQEEILGVPLLLAKATYEDKGQTRVVLTGLLYNAARQKLLFRLEASGTDYDAAETAWRTAFQTLRTTDGSNPLPDDPNRKLTPVELAPKPQRPPNVVVIGQGKVVKAVYGPTSLHAITAARKVLVQMPKGWQVSPNGERKWLLTNPTSPLKLDLTIASTLDSDPPSTALLKASGADLDNFVEVSDRAESATPLNQANQSVQRIFRTGKGKAGPFSSMEAVVANGDLYLMVRLNMSGVLNLTDRKVIDDLLNGMSIVREP